MHPNVLFYALTDHLGSASVVTDSTGATVGEDRFYPSGETRFKTGDMQTDQLFTGQREVNGLGIYFFQARFYSPKLGRFLSADTIVPSFANPQSLNRYSYVLNRPIIAVDPSGHKCVSTGPNDCLNDNLKPINGAGGLTPWKPSNNNSGNPTNNNQPAVSNNVVSIPVGVSSSWPAPTSTTYAEQAEEGSCGGCSMEPISESSPLAANPFDLANFGLTWYSNSQAVNSRDIPVYANIIINGNGSISVHSLTVDNIGTNISVATVAVSFQASGNNSTCFAISGCVTRSPYLYTVQSQLGIYSSETQMPGIGAVAQPNSMQVVNLTPSGYLNNQNNTFYDDVKITVVLGNSRTGDVYLPISVTLSP